MSGYFEVEAAGMQSVAAARQDLRAHFVHRGPDGWRRRPGTPESLGSLELDYVSPLSPGPGSLVMRVPAGSQESFVGTTLATMFACVWVLDDLLSDQVISYVELDASWAVASDSGVAWTWALYTAPDLTTYTVTAIIKTNETSSGVFTLTPPAGTKALMLIFYAASGPYAVTAERSLWVRNMNIYSCAQSSRIRLDQAAVYIAERGGLAASTDSSPVGAIQDKLVCGAGTQPTSAAAAVESLAALHAQPVDYQWGLRRSFRFRPRLWTPDNDARILVVGREGEGGLAPGGWQVAEDETTPDYAEVIYGNKDDTSLPEGWPRKVYRPSEPADRNARLIVANYAEKVMSDAAAAGIGDYLAARGTATVPPDYVFRFHAARCRTDSQGQPLWPNDNENSLTRGSVTELSDGRAVGTVYGCGYTTTSGHAGSNSPDDPSRIQLDGSGDYVSFGNLAALNLGGGARTIIVRVRIDTVPGAGAYASLFSKRLAVANYTGYELFIGDSDRVYVNVTSNFGTGAYRQGYGTGIAATGDYCFAFTYNGSEVALRTNGHASVLTLSGSQGAYDTDSAAVACIGARNTSALYLDGGVTEVIVYKRVLSNAEIDAIYEAGPCLYDRSFAKGTVVLDEAYGVPRNRRGAPIRVGQITTDGWAIENTEAGYGQRRVHWITGTSVSGTANNLTIGADAMLESIGARWADVLALAPSVTAPVEPVRLADQEAAAAPPGPMVPYTYGPPDDRRIAYRRARRRITGPPDDRRIDWR